MRPVCHSGHPTCIPIAPTDILSAPSVILSTPSVILSALSVILSAAKESFPTPLLQNRPPVSPSVIYPTSKGGVYDIPTRTRPKMQHYPRLRALIYVHSQQVTVFHAKIRHLCVNNRAENGLIRHCKADFYLYPLPFWRTRISSCTLRKKEDGRTG